MKFIFQKQNPLDDFKIELIKSKEYWDWRNVGKEEEYKTEITILTEGDDLRKDSPREYCPVGSIEFCLRWFKEFYQKSPKPINIPMYIPGIENFTRRDVIEVDLTNSSTPDYNTLEKFIGKKLFIKDMDNFKSSMTQVLVYNQPEDLKVGYRYQVSEFIPNLVSEWRCFIYQGSLLGIQCYLGDYFRVPQKDFIEDFIRTGMSYLPVSYTLDVMVSEDGVTRLLEIHDFFSCGLYGFTNPQKFPFMCYRWFKNYIR